MLNIDQILELWKKDAEIDEMALDEASRQSARLHAKYLEMLTMSKLQLKRKEMQQKTLLKEKWSYYNGMMTKEEMDEKGWDYDPFKGGRKPLKSDLGYFFESDPELQKSQAQIDYINSTIETLESIMTNITWRHQNIKNMIDWRKFTSGV
jgi:hypothetical protein